MGSSSEISLKLLVDTKSNKVIFAEAGKQFVDLIFILLKLPISTVAGLISDGTGSVRRLYESVDNMDASYLQPNFDKTDMLEMKALMVGGGYVKAPHTYIVTDGLKVTPMAAISTIGLAKRYALNKDVELAEKVVTVVPEEYLAFIAAMMGSDTVLSDVFLARKK